MLDETATSYESLQATHQAALEELIADSPFADMKGTNVTANRTRDYFVTRVDADAVLKACPNTQWKLLFALSRYGGLRCPSEHLALTWGDVNWNLGRITVKSVKTAHHAGHEERVMPLFPELLPHLQAAWNELTEDEAFDAKAAQVNGQPISKQPIITRYRDTNSNLRTQLNRVIKTAGLTPWPKLFQNLRASRATELAAEHPGHVAAAWLGHSEQIADKHCRQVTDADFERAARAANAQQLPTETGGTGGNERNADSEKQLDVRNSREYRDERMTPTGSELLQQSSSFDNSQGSGALSGAVFDVSTARTLELEEVVSAWPTLPESLRMSIVALIRKACEIS